MNDSDLSVATRLLSGGEPFRFVDLPALFGARLPVLPVVLR